MPKRKELKRAARSTLKRNYLRAVIVGLVMAVIAGAYSYSTQLDISVETGIRRDGGMGGVNAFTLLEGWLQNASGEGAAFATRGALSSVVRHSFSSGSVFLGIFNATSQLVAGRVSAMVLILVGIVVYILYATFVSNVLAVGEARFYLEARRYQSTQPRRLLFIYRLRRTRHVAAVMFWQLVAVIASFCLVVPGFIVVYQLRLVPQILAENPGATRKQAFRLSRKMMRGHKWRTFLLDLSFMGWTALSLLTFGILGFLYLNPYLAATEAELYARLRAAYLEANPEAAGVLNDSALFPEALEPTPYPTGRFSIPEAESRQWLNLDYHRRYTFTNIALMFFTFMLIGWLWEVAIELFGKGIFVNRGSLHGPWLPLYGCGGVLCVLVLRRFVDKPVVAFFVAVGMCGVLEYGAGLMLELVTGVSYWDYTGYFLNIQGRVCAEGLLVFGLAGCLGVYLLAPVLDNFFGKLPKRFKTALVAVLLLTFASDVVYSAIHPNQGEHITFSLDAEENLEQYGVTQVGETDPWATAAWAGRNSA